MNSIKLFNGIVFSQMKRNLIVAHRNNFRYVHDLECEHFERLMNRVIFDSVVNKERIIQMEEMTRRMIYWMDRSEVAERKIQEMKNLKKLKVIIN